MKPRIVLAIVLAAPLSSLTSSFGTFRIHQDDSKRQSIDWRTTTRDEMPEPADPNERAIREARRKAFNDKTNIKRRLDIDYPDSDKWGWGMAIDRFRLPALPANLSDAVLVGEVVDFQPYLSNDRTTVFTELTFHVEKVFKDTFSAARVDGTITISELGGSLRLKNGRVMKDFAPRDETTLDVQHRYVVFATYDLNTRLFTVIKAWELVDGHARPKAQSDISDAEKGKSPYAGLSEDVFLDAVQKDSVPSGSN